MIETSFTMEVMDLDMAIRASSMNTLMMRYNRNIEDFRRAHDDLQKAMLARSLPVDVWEAASQSAAPLWKDFEPFLDHLDNEVRDLCTRAILLWRQYNSWPARLLRGFGILRTWPLKVDELQKARREFDTEREKSLAESRKKMAEARGTNAEPTSPGPLQTE